MLKKLRQKKWFKVLSNRYVLVGVIFSVWMLFLDANSFLVHRELNKEIEELETGIDYYQNELEHDRQRLHELESDTAMLEKFAREQYWMKKPNEEIYLIEFEEEE